MLLAADIGGTKTAVALFSRQSGLDRPLASRTFASRDYPSLEALLRQFLQGSDARPAIASLGLPGPVRGRRAELLERVPVHVVTDPAVALRGAALHGLEQIEGLEESQT